MGKQYSLRINVEHYRILHYYGLSIAHISKCVAEYSEFYATETAIKTWRKMAQVDQLTSAREAKKLGLPHFNVRDFKATGNGEPLPNRL